MSRLHVCIPVLDELETLPITLECLERQDLRDFSLTLCVNQPEAWWKIGDKLSTCEHNAATLAYLKKLKWPHLVVIDHSSPGNGWGPGRGGVGHARKAVMDHAAAEAAPDDIIVSLDADTTFGDSYLDAVKETLLRHPQATALSVPYYHKLTGDESADRAILRYEIYMRNYAWNLYRIRNPYAFTALGSAMALPVKAYKAIGGMTPKHSGEDFYFLQKLRKYGPVLNFCPEKVYPAARFSSRVNFGTGPAMIKGAAGDWDSYPIYTYSLFDRVKETFESFATLFRKDCPTPMSTFITEVFRETDPWQALRENFVTEKNFIRACWQKVDALRILQFLKNAQKNMGGSDEDHLIALFRHPEFNGVGLSFPSDLSFSRSPLSLLDAIRNVMVAEEDKMIKIQK